MRGKLFLCLRQSYLLHSITKLFSLPSMVDYRCCILYWCPHLIVLDGTSTTDEERYVM